MEVGVFFSTGIPVLDVMTGGPSAGALVFPSCFG